MTDEKLTVESYVWACMDERSRQTLRLTAERLHMNLEIVTPRSTPPTHVAESGE